MSDDVDKEFNENFGKGKKEKAPPIVEDVCIDLMLRYRFLTIEETGEIWYFKEGVYVRGGEILIAKEAEKMYGYELNTEKLSQIIGHIKRRTYHKHEEIDADINIINVENGLYDVDNDLLKPHSPDYLTINQKPIIYDKDAKAERYEQFLCEVLYQRDIRTGIEAMAYTFERDYPVEVIFILLGLGRNGKTVFTSVLTSMHGKENVSNVPLSQMLKDIFALSDLENKDLNVDNELGNQAIRDTAVIKRLTGGSRQQIRIQRKNQRAYNATLYAKLFFNANKIPDTEDDSIAYNRRIILISFPNQFEGVREDKQLIPKLTTDKEKSGIFNILMNALRQIRQNGDIYVNEKTSEERHLKYLRAHNSIRAFMEEVIDWESSTENEDAYISKTDLHLVYNIYCSVYRIPAVNYDTFCKRFKKTTSITIDKEETQITIYDTRKAGEKDANGNSKMIRCWTGIKLTPEYARELLDAKKKANKEEGQENLDEI